MRHLLIAAVLLLGPLGCASVPGAPPAPSAAYTAILSAGKALYAAEVAFDAASLASEQGAASGAIRGKTALAVLDALDKAHSALQVARSAYKLGDAATVTQQAARANAAVSVANAAMKP